MTQMTKVTLAAHARRGLNIKFRSQPEQNKTSRYSITDDSISKYDDIMDLTDAPNINTSYRSAESDIIQT